MSPIGRHVIADLYACAPECLNDVAILEDAAVRAVQVSGGTILVHHARAYEPQGVTVFVMVAESHLSLHTWPEHRYVAVDYFTCGDGIAPERAVAVLSDLLRPERVRTREIPRGDEL